MTEKLVLRADDIHKSFGALEVLKGITLEARNHDVISILGSSGSGKSTFLRCLNMLDPPTSGRVWVHGEEIAVRNGHPADMRQVERARQRLGMVFQQFNLWTHRTVLENVMEGPIKVLKQPKAEVKEQGMTVVEDIDMDAFRQAGEKAYEVLNIMDAKNKVHAEIGKK